MSTTHPSVPVQSPLQLANVDAALGVATSCTAELAGYAIAHTPDSAPRVMVQESCGDASGVVTVPEPAPFACTRSTWFVVVGRRTALTPSLWQAADPTTTNAVIALAHRSG